MRYCGGRGAVLPKAGLPEDEGAAEDAADLRRRNQYSLPEMESMGFECVGIGRG